MRRLANTLGDVVDSAALLCGRSKGKPELLLLQGTREDAADVTGDPLAKLGIEIEQRDLDAARGEPPRGRGPETGNQQPR